MYTCLSLLSRLWLIKYSVVEDLNLLQTPVLKGMLHFEAVHVVLFTPLSLNDMYHFTSLKM